ncbi:MAG: SDR family oxidoreductase [Planctomycetaceae bacterium]|nr:SDR family oxidoreductase [Planctomycetaceae bacterium]
MRFENSVIIVTGPSDTGIGGAIAESFAEQGATICLLGIERPERLIKRLQRRDTSLIWLDCDVCNTREVDEAVLSCHKLFERIDVLVNNAGVEFSVPFEQIDDDQWDRLLSVNLTGAMKMTRSVLPFLTEQGGVIVNIASALGMVGCAGYHAYSASKAGLIGMTQSLALELAPRGQRAVCVAPAIVKTPMSYKHATLLDKSTLEDLESAHPLGVGSPNDVANAVLFLASKEASWITGISLPLGWIPSWGLPTPGIQSSLKKNNEYSVNQ